MDWGSSCKRPHRVVYGLDLLSLTGCYVVTLR